jgi:hypothetical protein
MSFLTRRSDDDDDDDDDDEEDGDDEGDNGEYNDDALIYTRGEERTDH